MEWIGWALAVVLALALTAWIATWRQRVSTLDDRERRIDEAETKLQEGTARLADDRRAWDEEARQRAQRRAQEDAEAAEARATREAELAKRERGIATELERVGGLTEAEARAEIVDGIVADAKLEAVREARAIEHQAKHDAEREARTIIVQAIQRMAADQTSESLVTTVPLPTEDMKGRIIGREGRNIRTFEQLTGANLLIDEAQSVTISCFDPARRETARMALDALIADGNIHPARIEHVVAKAKRDMDDRIREVADDALAEVGIVDLDPSLIPTLGALAFRTSYGQNVLAHLVECAHLAATMAAELGLDVATCKRAAFLHDIGKALTHDHEGSHALLGADLLRRHGEHEDIVHAVEAHHNEVEPRTVEAWLTQAADAISGSRPGARRESLEAYLERMETLERVAASKPGVARAFAMQAGHEVRVMVLPEEVDDEAAHVLAHDIAKEIQDTLTFPGQIRVTVVRESRATAMAR